MIDATLQDKCMKLIYAKVSERRRILDGELRKINNSTASRSTFGSSVVQDEFYQLICGEFKIRSSIAWQEIVKAHKVLGSKVTADIRDDFKNEFYNYTREACLELTFKLQKAGGNASNSVAFKLDDLQAQIIEKYNNEIDVYVDSLTKPSLSNTDSTPE